jgi:hypothetical protein
MNRFYRNWQTDNGYNYKLTIYPSHDYIDAVDTITYGYTNTIELPAAFVLEDMSLVTELGEIPAGIVSQTLELNVNIAALQGTTELNDLRGALLKGTNQTLYPIKSAGAFPVTNFFKCFNTFVLECDYGTGTMAPIFIGCQKFASENELNITKLQNVVAFRIELYDIMRCIGEMIPPAFWQEELRAKDAVIDWGNGFTQNEQTEHKKLRSGSTYAEPLIGFARTGAIDITVEPYYYYASTFERMQSKVNEMYAGHLRALIPNYNNPVTVPVPFAKAWTFYQNRLDRADTLTAAPKIGYITDIKHAQTGEINGGPHVDKNAFAKYNNFHEVIKLIAEQSLEIYRLQYSASYVSGWYGAAYAADFCLPSEKSGGLVNGILFNTANIVSDVKIKLLQETLAEATANVSTLQGDKDTQEYPAGQQGTSGDNSKDIRVIFHNLTIVTDRKKEGADAVQFDTIDNTDYYVRNGIAAGQIVYNDNGTIRKVDTQCRVNWNYGYTELATPNLTGTYIGRNAAIIREQQTTGLPLTLATAMVTVLGDPKQAVAEFDTILEHCKYTDVGKECRIDFNALNPLLSAIYDASTARGVITKHSHNIKTNQVQLSIRVHGLT